MRDVFATQSTRRFVHGFTLLGAIMELWVFDRSGPYSSGPFDIHEKPECFIKAVAGYTMMSNEELGLDTFIERKVENGFITVTEDATRYGKKLWLEPDVIAYQRAIVCRGTSCFRAGILGTEDPQYVVKFSWTSDKRPPEADLLRLARERGVKGVAKLFGFHRITSIADIREGLTFIKSRTFRNATLSPSSSFSQSQSQALHQSFNQLHGLSIAGGSLRKRKSIDAGGKSSKRSRSNSQGPDRAKQGNEVAYAMEENQTPSLYAASLDPFDNRIFRCLVISPAGRAIDDFKSILELLEALRDAIKMVTGLFRCIRCENGSTALISVGLESPLSVNRVARHVMRIVANISTLPSDQWETEYEERDGRLCINRVMAANHLNRSIYPKTIERSNQQKFGYEDRALALRVGTTGLLDTLDFVQDTQGGQRMAPDEVEVKVKAVGVNFKDILTALGRLPEGELGLECAGIVTRACPGVKVVPGDRVCVTGLGTYRTYVRIAARHVHQIPDPMSFSEATALPVVYCAAYQALYECARIAPQESILIHSGASGTGQAAIQLSRLADAEIFVTVGSEDEKKLIMDLYAIPEDHIFASRGLSFKKGVKRMTKGRGVDIVLNSLSGERLQASWDCLAPFGRFIEIGKNDIIQGSKLSMLQFAENRTFTAIDLVHMLRERPTLIEKTMQAILTLAESGRIKSPQPLHIFSISNIEGAFRYLQGGTNTGKTIVEIDDDAMVPVAENPQPSYNFYSQSTYVIAGGLEGIGRSITRWMAHRGARHLVLLSRSGAASEDARAFLEELRALGVTVEAPVCDISDEQSVKDLLSTLTGVMPPIRGCIQASMVLQNSLFEHMSCEAFNAAIRPKVHGSWNLHTLLPQGLDFFVLLSSIAGVLGSPAQANYAAGNTFQDALACQRVSHGEKAASIDLGIVTYSGYVADHPEARETLERSGLSPITEHELLSLLEILCNPSLKILSPIKSQIIFGLQTPATLKAQGLQEITWMEKPQFRLLHLMDNAKAAAASTVEDTANTMTLLSAATSVVEAAEIIAEALTRKLSRLMSLPKEDVDASKPMHVLGVDSLVAVEVRSWFSKEVDAGVKVFNILGNKSIFDLCLEVARAGQYGQTAKTGQV